MENEEIFYVELHHGDVVTNITTTKADMDSFFIDLRTSHFTSLESVNSTAVLILSSDFKFMKIAKKQ